MVLFSSMILELSAKLLRTIISFKGFEKAFIVYTYWIAYLDQTDYIRVMHQTFQAT